jgi:hypothetical protein
VLAVDHRAAYTEAGIEKSTIGEAGSEVGRAGEVVSQTEDSRGASTDRAAKASEKAEAGRGGTRVFRGARGSREAETSEEAEEAGRDARVPRGTGAYRGARAGRLTEQAVYYHINPAAIGFSVLAKGSSYTNRRVCIEKQEERDREHC